jgi:hypothetical protein
VPPGALAAFLDRRFDEQLGRGDERIGTMPHDKLIPGGFGILDQEARRRHGGPFAELDGAKQDAMLKEAEGGEIAGPDGFDSAEWFRRTRALLLLAYGSDPRGMVEMGFPGPSYAKGHVWLDLAEVASRAAAKRGYEQL